MMNLALLLVVCLAQDYGPRYAVGQKDMTIPSGVLVRRSESLASKASSSPERTVFVLESGTHYQSKTVYPRKGQQFWGRYGAVLDGRNSTRFAFQQGGVDVRIGNLVIQNYATPFNNAAIEGGDGWQVNDCEVHRNKSIGVRVGDGGVIQRCYLHHNGQQGFATYFAAGVMIEDTETAWHNPAQISDGTRGGCKLWASDDVTIRYCFSHDNNGAGLWSDGGCADILYEWNRVEDNRTYGIFHEISYWGLIRFNLISGSRDLADGTPRGGIAVVSSPDVEVHDNVVLACDTGILIADEDNRLNSTDRYGQRSQRNAWVHSNIVDGSVRAHVRVVDWSSSDGFNPWNAGNRFDFNSYSGSPLPKPFQWRGSFLSWSGWQAKGQDQHGTFE